MKRPVATPKRGKLRFFAGAVLLLVALGASACASDAPQDYLNHPVGKAAQQADAVWDLTFGIAVVVFVLVEGALVYALIKYRHREGRHAAQFHGNTKLEVILTLIPALLLAGVAIPTLNTIFELAAEREGSLDVKVIGHQFWWEYQYPDSGVATANELHIPTGTPVRVAIEGDPNDVIHSFWVPRLAPKQDVVPGHTNYINLETDEPGVYLGQCAEYCGLSHGFMRLRVIAQEPDDFQEWLAAQQEPADTPPRGSLAAEGRELFLGAGGCAGCHTIDGTDAQATTGPELTHLANRETFAAGILDLNEENLQRWVADAPAVKPGVKMPSGVEELGLTEEEVDKLVAYLLTLE